MYNRYLDAPAPQAEDSGAQPAERPVQAQAQSRGPTPPAPAPRTQSVPRGHSALLGEVTGGLGEMLGGVLKGLSLKNLDTGDILLILIILFLFLEGDNLEIAITLGLMLLLGLGDDD